MSDYAVNLTLRIHPDACLRRRCEPVGRVDQEVCDFAERMVEIMREEDGIGLAAPQIGVNRRLFVCDVPADPRDTKPEDQTSDDGVHWATDGPLICIDPVVTEPSDDRTPFEEGCLSIPGIRGDVIRPERIRLQATGLDGKPFSMIADGLLARCIQHESDHLDGVLILDKMTQMSRLKNRRKIRELEDKA